MNCNFDTTFQNETRIKKSEDIYEYNLKQRASYSAIFQALNRLYSDEFENKYGRDHQ